MGSDPHNPPSSRRRNHINIFINKKGPLSPIFFCVFSINKNKELTQIFLHFSVSKMKELSPICFAFSIDKQEKSTSKQIKQTNEQTNKQMHQ